MDATSNQDNRRKWFLWGAVLAWIPALPVLYWMVTAIRDSVSQKQTGLGAVAGGVSEFFATLGMVTAFVIPVAGIVLLVRSLPGGHPIRTLFAMVSVLWSTLILVSLGCAVWFLTHWSPR